MIPKIIHYVWFGGNKPQQVLDCIKTWQEVCPDYEIREWNERNCMIECDFFKEAIALRKYSFASDVVRLKVLSDYGGIYFDTDVRLISSLDPFLSNRSFVGKELPFRVGTAVIGSEPHVPWVDEFLNSYTVKGKHFIQRDGNLDMVVNTIKLTDFLNCTWHRHKNDIEVYDEDVFCCKSYFTGNVDLSERSVAIHDFSCSWSNPNPVGVFEKLKRVFLRISLLKNK